jgi:hypothetical protein
MFIRLVRFSFGPGKQGEAQAIVDEIVPLIADQPGCERVTMFGDDSDGEYGIIVYWDTREHADEAAVIVSPKLMGHFEENVRGEPELHLFPVKSSLPAEG